MQRSKIYFVLLLLCAVFTALSPLFATWENLLNVLLASATIGLLTIGAALVIASGGIDLSVGSTLAFSGAVASLAARSDLPWPIVVFTCLASGMGIGLLNGVIIARLAVPAFIVTLGTLSVIRGFALVLTDGRPIYGLPAPIVFIGQGQFLSIPIPIWIFLAAGLVADILLRRTVFGIHTLSIGDNQRAVRRAGVDVSRHKVKLYALSGLFAALAGLIFMGRVNAADPSAGLMYELTAITGAIIGGTRLFGGRASVVGAMAGAVAMGILQNGLTLLAVPSYFQQIALGTVLILAVIVDRGEGDES